MNLSEGHISLLVEIRTYLIQTLRKHECYSWVSLLDEMLNEISHGALKETVDPIVRLNEILKLQRLPKEVNAELIALVEGLMKERDEWKHRAARHGCDIVNGDDDCG